MDKSKHIQIKYPKHGIHVRVPREFLDAVEVGQWVAIDDNPEYRNPPRVWQFPKGQSPVPIDIDWIGKSLPVTNVKAEILSGDWRKMLWQRVDNTGEFARDFKLR